MRCDAELLRGVRNQGACLKLYQFRLRKFTWTENRDLGNRPPHHGDLITGVESWACLAVFVDLVRQHRSVDNAKAEVKEEVRNTREQADGRHALLLGLF